jgi:hypothetical protein
MGVSTLSGLSRGQNGTAPAAHSAGAPVRALDDPLHWTYDDAYWVYGQSPNEVWVKYSDGSVWQQGGQAPVTLPQITGVQVVPNGTTATIMFSTDVPASAWVEYDTYGSAEAASGRRPAGWWPNYLLKTNLSDPGAPAPATRHTRTLTGLQPGEVYHYRIVVRGPVQAVTPDATFVAGAPPAPSPTGATATVPPSATAVPLSPTATRSATTAPPSPTASATTAGIPRSPTPIPSATPPARPNVAVITTPNQTSHTLQTSVTARDAGCAQGNNQLQALRFTRLTNASVDVLTSPATSVTAAPQTVSLPGHPASVTLTTRRVTDSQPTVVEFTVTDGCGDWPTFVGGGPSAF